MMIPTADDGRLTAVRGVDEAHAVEGVTGVEITVPIGTELIAPPHGDRYLGFIFVTAPDREAAIERLRRAHSRLEIVIS